MKNLTNSAKKTQITAAGNILLISTCIIIIIDDSSTVIDLSILASALETLFSQSYQYSVIICCL